MFSLLFLLTALVGVSRDEVERTTSIIEDYLSTAYAPCEWKSATHEIDFPTLLNGIENAKTVREYQSELKKRLDTLRDHHVSLRTYSTELASLPFTICKIDGEFLVKEVYDEEIALDIRPGDRVISMDGSPIELLVEKRLCSNPTETEVALACEKVTWRRSEETPPTCHLTLEREGRRLSYELAWDRSPERIPDREVYKEGIDSVFDITRLQDLHLCTNKAASRTKRGVLPSLGEIVWESEEDSPFYGYLYKLNGKTHGFLRLSTYDMEGDEEFYEKIRALFKKFQDEAETLVIDQTENSGGYLFFGYFLLSMLTDRPLSTPKEFQKITDSDIYFAVSRLQLLDLCSSNFEAQLFLGESFLGYPVDLQFLLFYKNYLNFIKTEGYLGKSFIGPTHLFGVDEVNPHPEVRFTGPLVMWIDECCFSSADFVPAILQDSKRALLVGTKTAGAGGFVRRFRFPNRLGIQEISLTGSIAFRANGQPIEDLGVTPDITLPINKEDLVGGFQRYAEELKSIVRTLSEKKALLDQIEETLIRSYAFKEEKRRQGFDIVNEFQELKSSLLTSNEEVQQKLVAFADKVNDPHLYFTFSEKGRKNCRCPDLDEPPLAHIDGKEAYLRIGNFSEWYHPKEVERWIESFEHEADSLRIDLRNTSGGELQNMDHFASLFLKEETSYSLSSGEKFLIKPHPSIHFTKPLRVLIDGCTHSAAELFAALMQDTKRGELVGERTAGAGGVQEVVRFGENSFGILELHFPSRALLRPSGIKIEGAGIEAGDSSPVPLTSHHDLGNWSCIDFAVFTISA